MQKRDMAEKLQLFDSTSTAGVTEAFTTVNKIPIPLSSSLFKKGARSSKGVTPKTSSAVD